MEYNKRNLAHNYLELTLLKTLNIVFFFEIIKQTFQSQS